MYIREETGKQAMRILVVLGCIGVVLSKQKKKEDDDDDNGNNNKDNTILQNGFGIFGKNKEEREGFKDNEKIKMIKSNDKEINNEIIGQSSYQPPMSALLLNKNKKEDEIKEKIANYDKARALANPSIQNIYNLINAVDDLRKLMVEEMAEQKKKKGKDTSEERIDYKIIEVTDNDEK